MAHKPEASGLLATIEAAQATARRGSNCGVRLVLEQLSPEDANDLRAAIANDGITLSVIGKVLRDAGYKIGDDALRRHKRQVCACG